MTGITRKKAAQIAARHFGTTETYIGGSYDEYHVMDSRNRKWKFVFDSSIRGSIGNEQTTNGDYKVELVSPICGYDDIPTIQEIVRKLREAKATVNSSCGIHIHINGAPHTPQTLRNITNIMASKEDMIYKAMQVDVSREMRYCRKVDMDFLEKLHAQKPKEFSEIKDIWYNGQDGSRLHYHDSRYHCLNLHSLFSKGTIEFRLFNSTLHAGKIRSYITLCLAISNQALTQKCASRRRTISSNEKYTFRCWLLRLGLIGDEFKNVRAHLLEHLDGCIAWKNPDDAIRQREEIKAKREQERNQIVSQPNEQANEQTNEQAIAEEVRRIFSEENETEQIISEEHEPILSM